jgi:branched-chain amino acid transport system permease protein
MSALGPRAGPVQRGGPGPAPGRLRLPQQTLARHLMIAAGFGLALLVVSELLDPYRNLQLATAAYYFAALAGLTVLTGLNGQISIGHGALMAIGAYASAKLIAAGWALVPALILATLISAAAGGLFGAAAARLRGPYLAGATLALAVGLPGLADRYPATFGGENGLTVTPPTPPASLGATFPLERWQAWIACLGALVVYVLLANLVRGGVGRAFRAVRDDEISAQLSGVPVARTQVLAFVISAACGGLGGSLYVVVNSLAAPGAFTLALSLSLLTGIVLGGLGSLAGAAWGALALVFLPAWCNDLAHAVSLPKNVAANLPLALYGIALIAVMLAAPQGIQGGLRSLAGWRHRRGTVAARRPGETTPNEGGSR